MVAVGWVGVGAVAAVVLSVKVTGCMQSEEQQDVVMVRGCWVTEDLRRESAPSLFPPLLFGSFPINVNLV